MTRRPKLWFDTRVTPHVCRKRNGSPSSDRGPFLFQAVKQRAQPFGYTHAAQCFGLRRGEPDRHGDGAGGCGPASTRAGAAAFSYGFCDFWHSMYPAIKLSEISFCTCSSDIRAKSPPSGHAWRSTKDAAASCMRRRQPFPADAGMNRAAVNYSRVDSVRGVRGGQGQNLDTFGDIHRFVSVLPVIPIAI